MNRSPWLAVINRNPDGWLASLKLTGRSLFYAPSCGWWLMGDAIKSITAGLLVLPFAFVSWVAICTAQLFAGLAGFLSEHPTNHKEGK